MKKIHLTILAAMLISLSCKKEELNNRTPLLSKSWIMTAQKVVSPVAGTPLEGYSTDWFNSSGCLENKLWSYRSNGELQIDEAPACITPNSKSSVLGKWMFSSNGNQINIEIEWFGTFSYDIIELNQQLLRVQRKQTVSFGSAAGNPPPAPVDVVIQYDFEPK